MLTADLVRARRKGQELRVIALSPKTRPRAEKIASELIDVVSRLPIGSATRADLHSGWDEIPMQHGEQRLVLALRKLLEDRCTFEIVATKAPAELREVVFGTSARHWREADHFQRTTVLAEVAAGLGLTTEDLERGLFADLRDEHRIVAFEAVSPTRLLEAYELAQEQAVLLRAVRVEVDIVCRSPAAYRALFRKFKFLRLLYRIEGKARGYRVILDGPVSMFSAATKYGLQLAMMLPLLRDCDEWSLRAELRWGPRREPMTFSTSGRGAGVSDNAVFPDEVDQLLRRFRDRNSDWSVEPAVEILSLPGVGECVPDLEFRHAGSGARVFLEALGFWSRDAVFRRIELVERGLTTPILFAVPRRLRVSEALLDEKNLPAALYVYRGVIGAKEVEERLDRIHSRLARKG